MKAKYKQLPYTLSLDPKHEQPAYLGFLSPSSISTKP